MNHKKLYPLKVSSIAIEKIWGGRKLDHYVTLPHHKLIGEVLLISDEENGSRVLNGRLIDHSLREVCRTYGASFIGTVPAQINSQRFPLILKLIHAEAPLSIQVHPNKAYTCQHEQAWSGKTEAWFILEATPEAHLAIGFRNPLKRTEIAQSIQQGTLEELVNTISVRPGDTFFLPPGRVHSMGAGVVLVEIQENCPITYRLYDFDRVDPQTGKKRKLDVAKALDVLDFEGTSKAHTKPITIRKGLNECVTFVLCPSFCGQKLTLVESQNFTAEGSSCSIYSVLYGQCSIRYGLPESSESVEIHKGETVIIPAQLGWHKIQPQESHVVLFKFFVPDIPAQSKIFEKAGISEADLILLGDFETNKEV